MNILQKYFSGFNYVPDYNEKEEIVTLYNPVEVNQLLLHDSLEMNAQRSELVGDGEENTHKHHNTSESKEGIHAINLLREEDFGLLNEIRKLHDKYQLEYSHCN